MPCATTDRVIICCAKWQSLSQCDFCLRFKITTIDKIGQCKVGIFKQMVKLKYEMQVCVFLYIWLTP